MVVDCGALFFHKCIFHPQIFLVHIFGKVATFLPSHQAQRAYPNCYVNHH